VPLGTFTILALNLGLFVADHILRLPGVSSLYLYHAHPQWFQFLTCTFCHASWCAARAVPWCGGRRASVRAGWLA